MENANKLKLEYPIVDRDSLSIMVPSVSRISSRTRNSDCERRGWRNPDIAVKE
jgi:hypothetical protein